MSQAAWTRLVRVSACLAQVTQWIQSRRALIVMSSHAAFAFGASKGYVYTRSEYPHAIATFDAALAIATAT
mgnify:CR=1 FL=1